MNPPILVIGAGLAGTEAALQLSALGHRVRLVDQKPAVLSPVHRDPRPAEIVCSNSFGSQKMDTGAGILKAELAILDCRLLALARQVAVAAGHSLSVDREAFAAGAERLLDESPGIERVTELVDRWPDPPALIATGPVTAPALQTVLRAKMAGELYFYDAVSPVVSAASIDFSRGFFGSRYDPEGRDYFNIPFSRAEYERLIEALGQAETVPLAEFDKPLYFEACLPVEELLRRGPDTLRFGPLKPVGFESHFPSGQRPHALLQLRRENAAGDAFNLVGFQTRLRQGEQRRILRLIPGLEEVEILRYGLVHRNFYFHAPNWLGPDLGFRTEPGICFAGQMTGVEGYMESIATGLLAARQLDRRLRGRPPCPPPAQTMLGGLIGHLTRVDSRPQDYRPMNANFSLVSVARQQDRKKARREFGEQSLQRVQDWKRKLETPGGFPGNAR